MKRYNPLNDDSYNLEIYNTSKTTAEVVQNDSKYVMTDLVLQAVIKDSKGTEVGTKEFEIKGILSPEASSFVGTLSPDEEQLRLNRLKLRRLRQQPLHPRELRIFSRSIRWKFQSDWGCSD